MTLSTVVLDSSVILKLSSGLRETHVDLAKRLLQDILDGNVHAIAPRFLLIEFMNILIKKKGYGHRDTLELASALEQSGIVFVPLERIGMSDIVEAMHQHDISAYDSLYVVLARQEHCRLLTDDRKLSEIKGVGMSIQAFYHLH